MLGVSCGEDADKNQAGEGALEADAGGGGETDAGEGDAAEAGADEQPLYAISSLMFGEANESATAYVALLDSLDGQRVDLATSAEFAGWSSIAAMDGALFVGGGEAPEVQRFELTEDGKLGRKQSVSFANYGLSSVSFSHNAFFDPNVALLRLEETARIVWDPTALRIEGAVEAPELARTRDGLSISASNFEGIAVREDAVLWSYFWHDEDWYEFHQHSQIGVYAKDGSVKKLLDVPCPALNIATSDEQGNVYYSGMVDTVGYQLLETDSKLERCVVRINAGEEKIADGWPRRFEELTGGRPAGRFYYLADGKGLLTVFQQERAKPDKEDSFGTIFADHWALWLVDLEAWSAEPLDAWEPGSSNLFFSRVDGRTFLHKVAADFSETVLYEVKSDGSVTPQITVPGYSIVLVRVR
ncbi:MAG TPA: hypothetical protein VFZ61_25420 [Polyangiales bacterium]